jgi:hypothetical protein
MLLRRALLALTLALSSCGLTENPTAKPGGDDSEAGAIGAALPDSAGAPDTIAPAAGGAAGNTGGSAVGGDPGGGNGAGGVAGDAGGGDAAAGAASAPEATAPWVRVNLGLPPGLVSTLEVDQKRVGTVYAASFVGGGVYKTSTAGDSWRWASNGLSNGAIFDVAVDPFDSNVVLAASQRGLFRSTNAAEHWQRLDFGEGEKSLVWNIVFDPSQQGRIYVLTNGYFPGPYALPETELFRSDDAGTSWTSLGNPAGGFVQTLVVDPKSSQHLWLGGRAHGVYESVDAGASWSALPPPFDKGVNALAYAPETHTLCAEAQSYTYASNDNGASFRKSLSSISSLLARPGPTFYAVAGGGVFVSTDCFSWTLAGAHSAYAVAVEDDGTTYSGGYDWDPGVQRSRNGKDDWQEVNSGLENSDIHALALDPKTPSTLFAAVGRNGVYRSLDAAAGWQAANGLPSSYLGLPPENGGGWLEALAVNDGAVVAGGSGRLARSLDNGDSWVVSNMPALADGNLTDNRSLAFNPFDSQQVFVASISPTAPLVGVYASSDQGLNFSGAPAAAFDAQLIVPDPNTPHKLWAVGAAASKQPAAAYVSRDAGQSWAPLGLPQSGAVGALTVATTPGTIATVYIGVSDIGIFRSDDDGKTWSLRGKPEPANYTALVVDPTAPSTLYVATREASLDNLQQPHAGKSGIWKSKDAGASWLYAGHGMLDSVLVDALVIDPAHPQLLYAGLYHDGIYKTTTGAE